MKRRHRRPHPNRVLVGPVALLLATAVFIGMERSAHGAQPIPARDLFAAASIPAPPLPADGAGLDTTQVAPARATPSQSVTVNLINRLVAKGVLSKEDSAELVKQAEDDAAEAKAHAADAQEAVVQAAVAQAVAAAQASPPLLLAPDLAAPAPPSDDSVRVTYIPELVKKQLREQIKADVMAETKKDNLGGPRNLPGWVPRFRFTGDVRIRGERLAYPSGNDNTGTFPNFNAINTGSPFDVSGTVFSPQYNVDRDRNRLRLRVRLGVEVDLGEGFTAGLRIATGENNSPITTNQSLGLANQGQGGNFSKYAIWLDRGFLKYELGDDSVHRLALSAGRFDNPFFGTDIIWDDDLGFDGFALQGKYQIAKGFTPFFSGGAFPVFNTDLNFASNQPSKFKSDDKWLYGAQAGADWKIVKDLGLKLGLAYYYFDNIAGKLSDPYTPLTAQDAGNTDNTRPAFAQKGNTYRPLRNIIANSTNNFGTTNQFQYFGLASRFRDLALTGKLTYNHFEPFQVVLSGEYVKNLAFDARAIDAIAVNNRGANKANGSVGTFDGGDMAWIVGLKVGNADLDKRWDWNVSMNYRHVESDAVVDGFNDSDFGVGGTNLKGYTFGGQLALSSRVAVGLRWMSAGQIAGPPYKNDTLQIDLNGKF